MSKHVAGLVGLLVGLVVLAIMGLIWNAMLESIPHSDTKPQEQKPAVISVSVIPEPEKAH